MDGPAHLDFSGLQWHSTGIFKAVAHGPWAHPHSMKMGGATHLYFSGLHRQATGIFRPVSYACTSNDISSGKLSATAVITSPRKARNSVPCRDTPISTASALYVAAKSRIV
jgi:hypothetical protein